ncbi:hypothetical protein [Alienimonas californiensis]|uniref:Uncharacterized protein n=1 Tax=Alienimonas californiensis TaxID=2527989 RepID=A0A517PB16_9PLAN|nr:hypothetical protein [Alienimonas californiensis]QDT16573.1 hypothetical protein CA12_26790 [Alienimonas californiensis]
MLRSTLTLAATAALLAAGSSQADAGDRSRVSFQLSLGNGAAATYGNGYGGGYGSGYSSNYGNFGRSNLYGNSGGYGSSFSRPRFNSGYGSGNQFGRGYGQSGYGSGYGLGNSQHGSGHYDYHAPEIVPHGDHLDVTPGHYDFHQSHR